MLERLVVVVVVDDEVDQSEGVLLVRLEVLFALVDDAVCGWLICALSESVCEEIIKRFRTIIITSRIVCRKSEWIPRRASHRI